MCPTCCRWVCCAARSFTSCLSLPAPAGCGSVLGCRWHCHHHAALQSLAAAGCHQAAWHCHAVAASAAQQLHCAPPCARASPCARLQKSSEIIMFGGEYVALDTGKVYVYNDLCERRRQPWQLLQFDQVKPLARATACFPKPQPCLLTADRYNVDKDKWTKVMSPKGWAASQGRASANRPRRTQSCVRLPGCAPPACSCWYGAAAAATPLQAHAALCAPGGHPQG